MRSGLVVARSVCCWLQARLGEPSRDERGEMSEWIMVAALGIVAVVVLIALIGVVTGWSPARMTYVNN